MNIYRMKNIDIYKNMFQYISDIHLEFFDDDYIENVVKKNFIVNSEICILAGDIGNPYKNNYMYFMSFVAEKFKKVFIIAGNHEYYNGNKILDVKNKIKNIILPFNNIEFLDNSFVDYNGYRWIGSTLWSNISKTQYITNDTKYIGGLTIELFNSMHNENVIFLEDCLQKSIESNIQTIVITHYLPISRLVNEKFLSYPNNLYNQWYHANLDDLIKKYNTNIKVWIYGHTHVGSIQEHYDVKFICNPIGYENENKMLDWNKIYLFDI
jgi:predicted phosphodiesterase